MRPFLPDRLRALIVAMSLACGLTAAAASPAEPPPGMFDGQASGVRVVERDDAIGLANRQVGFWFRKRDGTLAGVWSATGGNLLQESLKMPIWSLELTTGPKDKPGVMVPVETDKVSMVARGDERLRTVDVTYESKAVRVVIHASLAAEDALVRWRMDAEALDPAASLWSVTFPKFPVAAIDADLNGNEMVVPYRRGQTRTYGKGAPRGDADLPYPGPSAKFQFMAAYGRAAGRGFYFAAEDGAGFTKSFVIGNHPEADAVVLAAQHFPANRGTSIKRFEMPYDVVAGPFTGDWWDASRIYRAWWVKQEWAGRGLLADRHDLPDWLVHAPIAARPSTTKPERTVANNVASLGAIREALGRRPFFGVWYGCFETPKAGASLNESGLGHDLPPKPGLVEAVRALRGQGIHLQAYIQSMIYDAGIVTPDANAAQQAVTRDVNGKAVPYGTGDPPNLLAMCRATDWWQRRVVELSRRAVAEWGFSGVYLDSFGKGAPECFAPDHGHPIGGGNTVIAGQRTLARRVREAVRAADPEAILSGEDPIEAFRDLLDVNLYSVNTMQNYVPVYRTVWGDYSLGHGRVFAPGKSGGTLLPELATLFLEGTIPGRIYTDSPKVFLLEPDHAKELAFLKSITAYTEHGLPWLRFGEYLHPLVLGPGLPPVEFHESVENKVVRVPAVIHSVTRSHADGSVAIVLVNVGNDPQAVSVPIDPTLRQGASAGNEARLLRMKEDGALSELAKDRDPWRQKIELTPGEVAFLILR